MLREIGSTHSLIMFPEGGRTTGETVGEFKSGLYYLSKKRPDLELVPVHIDNMNRVLPRGEFLPVPLLSCITFGPPMWLEAGETKNRFSGPGPAGRAAAQRSGLTMVATRLGSWPVVVVTLLTVATVVGQVVKRQPHLGLNAAAIRRSTAACGPGG